MVSQNQPITLTKLNKKMSQEKNILTHFYVYYKTNLPLTYRIYFFLSHRILIYKIL